MSNFDHVKIGARVGVSYGDGSVLNDADWVVIKKIEDTVGQHLILKNKKSGKVNEIHSLVTSGKGWYLLDKPKPKQSKFVRVSKSVTYEEARKILMRIYLADGQSYYSMPTFVSGGIISAQYDDDTGMLDVWSDCVGETMIEYFLNLKGDGKNETD